LEINDYGSAVLTTHKILKNYPTATICVAAFLGSSIWFSVNAVADGLFLAWGLTTIDLGHLTSTVQLGFILGTLAIALTGIADRFSASKIFAIAAVIGAITNTLFVLSDGNLTIALVTRFATGLTLAGIYPIGMKLIVRWVPDRAGNVLGWMVGLLLIGSGLPHCIRGASIATDWQGVLYISSGLVLLGGALIWCLGDGPNVAVAPSARIGDSLATFAIPNYRAAAHGYFGHMWELYAFFALTPFLLAASGVFEGPAVYLGAFAAFCAGGFGCIAGCLLSCKHSGARIACIALAGSATMCLLVPILYSISTLTIFTRLDDMGHVRVRRFTAIFGTSSTCVPA
jgi:MFS family permease